MDIPHRFKKFFPLLLILAAVVFLMEDQMRHKHPSPNVEETHRLTPSGLGGGEIHSHEETGPDHSDPESNRRMGIFHFNEGNKSLGQEKWDEAVRNYKMALHHNENFEEAYVNLSTTYLRAKQYDKAYETLKTLEQKNPKNPLLFYNLACYYSLTGESGPAFDALKKSVSLGYKDINSIQTDPDLDPLRQETSYKEWIGTF